MTVSVYKLVAEAGQRKLQSGCDRERHCNMQDISAVCSSAAVHQTESDLSKSYGEEKELEKNKRPGAIILQQMTQEP